MQSNLSLDQFGRWSGGVAAAAVAVTPEELSARFTA
ncbi:LuxR family transcriptional regulator, partial [Mesorhizobium sp. M7A.F.Ca.CA.002.07.1.1]